VNEWTLIYDEGNGWGHERRMRALGKSLEARGAVAALGPLRSPVRSSGIVVDAYTARADDRGLFDADVIVAFDDLTRDLAVDLVVDPSPGAERHRHPSAPSVLAGARYAVVDPEIRGIERRPIADTVEGVLVSFGAADTAGVAAEVAAEVAASLPDAVVELPVGSWWDGPVPAGVHPVRCPDGLAPRLARADLAVTAGGVTLLEALALGRPAVAVVWAENQRLAVEHAAAAGAVAASSVEAAARDAISLAGDPERRAALAARAARLVDGMGADRVAAEVLRLGREA
jgi:spore coat polysaccharide biosynthesis predicted glycosyltransferase SpsG